MRWAAAWLALALAGCTSGTSARLTVHYQDAWNLGGFEVDTHGEQRKTEVSSTVRVLLRDDWAGQPLQIDLWGDRAEERWAHGKTTLTPVRGKEVTGDIVMSRVPCGAWCTLGATSCQGDAVVTCTEKDADDCFVWASPTPCPSSAPFCSLGTCGTSCVDECAPGETRCDGPNAVVSCGQGDSDSCTDWLAPVPCPGGEVCSNGKCTPTCQDECADGETECQGNGVVTCGDLDGDGCREWGPVVPCGDGMSCSGGKCAAGCTDECKSGDTQCQGNSYKSCGQYDLDPCLDWSAGISCQSSDPCMEGQCTTTGCQSAPKVCMQPPASTCVDANTLRVYDGTGQCDASGTCDYTSHDVSCPNCPACDACAGVTCDTPPPATCISSTTLRTFGASGTCSSGSCSYPSSDTTCTSAPTNATAVCSGAACDFRCNTGYSRQGSQCVQLTGTVTAIAAGAEYTCALLSDGTVKCWGINRDGELGNNSTTDSHVPVAVQGLSGASAISAGGYNACALLSGGAVECWGNNAVGELGNGSTTASHVPVAVQGLSGVSAIAIGSYFTCGLSSGSVKCWGDNRDGELGNNSTTDSSVPVAVQGLSSVSAIAANNLQACALLTDGSVQCWGDNSFGQLGNNSTTNSSVPVAVQGLSGVSAIAAGASHTCALLSSGSVECWGYNYSGNLGNNSTTSSSLPVAVEGLSSATAIVAGYAHTCALLAGGTVECWGDNAVGELGNNSTTNSSVPVAVQGLSGVTAISSDSLHTCALLSSGSVECWGDNQYGELGNNSTTNSSVPVMVQF